MLHTHTHTHMRACSYVLHVRKLTRSDDQDSACCSLRYVECCHGFPSKGDWHTLKFRWKDVRIVRTHSEGQGLIQTGPRFVRLATAWNNTHVTRLIPPFYSVEPLQTSSCLQWATQCDILPFSCNHWRYEPRWWWHYRNNIRINLQIKAYYLQGQSWRDLSDKVHSLISHAFISHHPIRENKICNAQNLTLTLYNHNINSLSRYSFILFIMFDQLHNMNIFLWKLICSKHLNPHTFVSYTLQC